MPLNLENNLYSAFTEQISCAQTILYNDGTMHITLNSNIIILKQKS